MVGLTREEQGIVLFLTFSLLVGAAVKIYEIYFEKGPADSIDRSQVDEFYLRAAAINEESGDDFEIDITPSENSNAPQVQKSQPPPSRVKPATVKEGAKSSHFNESFLINLNTSGEEELQSIPKIGPVLAKRIVDYRDQNGPFAKPEDLKRVKGIGDKTFEKIKPYITLE